MRSVEIRKKYLDFFSKKGHSIIASAPIVPENDPTVLFNTAGMQPLVPYLLGENHPEGKRLVNCQKCIRTVDLDSVGDDSHLTFFEMLGNWSLGDYFKKEAISWSFEFLTSPDYLALDLNNLAFSVFAGDKDAPRDEESASIWQSLGASKNRISYLSKKDNWWGPAGLTGPCGPDTEMFYWVGEGEAPANSNVENDPENWLEIWNDVFMEYLKDESANYTEASQKNVDTGMGLERILAVLNHKKTVYETDAFKDLIELIEKISNKKYNSKISIKESDLDNDDEGLQTVKHMRIIADHVRTAVIMISDNVQASNVDQGYILRRLLRRAIRSGTKLGITRDFLVEVANLVIDKFSDVYPSVKSGAENIRSEISKEEQRFRKTIDQGLKEFDKLLMGFQKAFENTGRKITEISGKQAFKLYDTYGFPIEMTIELAREKGLTVDSEDFQKCYLAHQEKSRQGASEKFAGGLADHSEKTTAYHTATHLLHQALRDVLGDHVEQRGSNITAERLRFDFSHDLKMTDDEKLKVEEIVNKQIQAAHDISFTEMTVQEAKDSGAIGLFGDKYSEKVKVYQVGDYSREICGGPHVENTASMGAFKITKEQASSAGVRRIKAVLIK